MIGDYYRNNRQSPGTHAPINEGVCSRGCCWTPFGCGRQKKCECHQGKTEIPNLEAILKAEHEKRKKK